MGSGNGERDLPVCVRCRVTLSPGASCNPPLVTACPFTLICPHWSHCLISLCELSGNCSRNHCVKVVGASTSFIFIQKNFVSFVSLWFYLYYFDGYLLIVPQAAGQE